MFSALIFPLPSPSKRQKTKTFCARHSDAHKSKYYSISSFRVKLASDYVFIDVSESAEHNKCIVMLKRALSSLVIKSGLVYISIDCLASY